MSSPRQIGMLILLILCASALYGELQSDFSLYLPYKLGTEEIDDQSEGSATLLNYAYVVPDVRVQYYFGGKRARIGPGLRAYTTLIQTSLYPILSIESQLGDFVVNLNTGGGPFLYFGLYNSASLEAVVIPELSIAYRFYDFFSLGAGFLFLSDPTGSLDIGAGAWSSTLFARVSL